MFVSTLAAPSVCLDSETGLMLTTAAQAQEIEWDQHLYEALNDAVGALTKTPDNLASELSPATCTRVDRRCESY